MWRSAPSSLKSSLHLPVDRKLSDRYKTGGEAEENHIEKISTGIPRDVSPLLFSLYINDCTSDPSVKIVALT